MNRFAHLILIVSLMTLVGCPKSGGGTDPDTDSGNDVNTTDVLEDAQPDVPTPPEDVKEDTGPDIDPEPDVPVVPPSLTFWFVGVDGAPYGQDEDTVTFYPEDEPAQYASEDFPGFQMNIYVEVAGVANGAVISLFRDDTSVTTQQVVISDGMGSTTFGGVTLPATTDTGYAISVEVEGPDGLLSASKDVSVLTGACELTLTTAGDGGCISDADGAEFTLPVTVTRTSGDCDQATLSYTIGATGAPTDLPAVALDAEGSAVFDLALAADGEVIEDEVFVSATVTHPTSPGLTGATSASYTVDNGVPALTFSQPDGVVITSLDLFVDKDGVDANGLQYDIYGTVAGLDSTDLNSVSLSIGETVVDTTTPSLGAYAFDGVTFTEDGSVTLSVSGTDTCGNVGTASVTLDVYATRPALTILSPVDGAVLLAKGDGDPATEAIFESTFEVDALQLTDGTPVEVQCKSTGSTLSATTVVSFDAGEVDLSALPVGLNTNQFGQAITCEIVTLGPNTATSNAVSVSVALPAPSLTIESPVEGAQLTSKQLVIGGQASNLEGQPLEVEVYEDGSVICTLSGGEIAGGILNASFDLDAECTGVGEGDFYIGFDAIDVLGNRISELVDEVPAVNVSIDTVAPGVQRLTPELALDPLANPAHADASAQPGYQVDFTFALTDEVHVAGGELCLTVADVPQTPPAGAVLGQQGPGCQVVDSASGEASWTGVTLQPGDNAYAVTGFDGFGNTAGAVSDVVNLNFVGLTVNITSPDPTGGDVFVASQLLNVTVNVANSEDASPIAAATVGLVMNGNALPVSPAADGLGGYTFSDVPLTGGGVFDELVATANFQGLDGASTTMRVLFKTEQPAIALAALPTTLNLASAECAGTQADCVLDVTATTTAVEVGQTATLDVDCGGNVMSYQTDVKADDAAVFSDVTLSHGGTCGLVAQVSDAASQSATTGEPVIVTVDRVRPSLTRFTQPQEVEGAVGQLEPLTVAGFDDASLDPGMQHRLAIAVAGLEEGTSIDAVLSWTDAETSMPMSKSLSATLSEDVADDGLLDVDFAEEAGANTWITWPEGDVMVTVSTVDAAGNAAVDLIASTLVQSNAPSVRIVVPASSGDACADESECSGGTCFNGQCWGKWGISETKVLVLNVSGLSTTTDNLRICSNAAGLSDAAGDEECESDDGNGPYFRIGPELSVTNGVPDVAISEADLPTGFQTLIAEIQPDANSAWYSTLEQVDPDEASRRLYVDLTAPTVQSVTCDSDTDAPANVLSYVEQIIADPPQKPGGTFQFQVTATEDGEATVFVNGEEEGTVEITQNSATFELVFFNEGISNVGVQVTDRAGNQSLSVTEPGAQVSSFSVDTIVPLIEWSAPTASLLNEGDVLDVVVTCVEGCETGGQVTLSHDSKPPVNLALTDGVATFDHATFGILEQGANALTAFATDSAFNQCEIIGPLSVTVDTVPPVVGLNAVAGYPLNTLPAVLDGAADDANPASNAFDLSAEFAVSSGATGWTLSLANCTDATYTDCGASTEVASGTVSGDTDVTRTVGVPIVDALSHHLLTVTVTDAVSGDVTDQGNVVTVTQGFSVQVTGCLVGLTNLIAGNYYGIADACPGGTPCGSATLALTADFVACGAVTEVRLYDGATQLAADADLAGGSASFDVTVNDGEVIDFMVRAFIDDAEQGASASQIRTMDFSPPTVAMVSQTIAGFTTPSDQATAIYGIDDDVDQAVGTGLQGHVAIQVTDTNLAGGAVTALSGTVGAQTSALTPSNPASVSGAFTASDETRSFLDLTFTDQGQTQVDVTVTDAAGNEASTFCVVEADLIAPAAPSLDPIAEGDVDERLPSVALSWTAVDEDAASGGAATTYDIRYSLQPIDEDNFEFACQVSALANTGTLPTPAAAGDPESYIVSGPDPSSLTENDGSPNYCKFASTLPADGDDAPTWHFALRVADSAGNWSPVTTASTDTLVYATTRIDATVFGAFTPFYTKAVPSVNGDALGDVAFGFGFNDAACLYYGNDTVGDLYTVSGLNGSQHACVNASTLNVTGAGFISGWFDTAGDVNGDGLQDVALSGNIAGKGFVAIYLAMPGGPDLTEPDVVITGADGYVGIPYFSWCAAGNFTGEANGENPIDAIGLGEPFINELQVIPGNASWTPGMGAAGSPVYIDTESAADKAAFRVFTFASTHAQEYGMFCQRAGDVMPTPDDDATAAEDLLISQNDGFVGRVFLHPGRPISAGGGGATVTESPAIDDCPDGIDCSEDELATRLFQDSTNATNTFGKVLTAGVDLTGDSVPEVVIGQPWRSADHSPPGDGKSVWVFDGAKLAGAAGQASHRVTAQGGKVGDSWIGLNGWALDASLEDVRSVIAFVGDFDGDATQDLAVTNKAFTAVRLYGNHQDDAQGFELGLFPYADAVIAHPVTPGAALSVATVNGQVDMNGDGLTDLVIGGGAGEILIVH